MVLLIGQDILLRILHPGQILGDQLLELRLVHQNGLNGAFDQVQALAEVLYGRRGHLPGQPPGYGINYGSENAEDQ